MSFPFSFAFALAANGTSEVSAEPSDWLAREAPPSAARAPVLVEEDLGCLNLTHLAEIRAIQRFIAGIRRGGRG
eukprot:8077927-Lingulodinium_polyedra.AAC.1